MKAAVLIGFQYTANSPWSLPGIVVDLYQAYRFAKRMRPDRIFVVTDIEYDENTSQYLQKAIFDDVVKGDVLTFIETLKEEGHYYRYSGLDAFKEFMVGATADADRLFVYYTGHGRNVDDKRLGFMMPDGNTVSMEEFKAIAFEANPEVVMVTDCCQAFDFLLPFKLNAERDVYTVNPNFDPTLLGPNKIVCLNSTSGSQVSVTLKDGTGSIFTGLLFRTLGTEGTNWAALLRTINGRLHRYQKGGSVIQTASLNASSPRLYSCWSWLLAEDVADERVEFDDLYHAVRIKKPEPFTSAFCVGRTE